MIKQISDCKQIERVCELVACLCPEEIVPTRKEIGEWKKNLYNSLLVLSYGHPKLYPRKRDSLQTLLESFLYWANEYNDGYFSERDGADNDRYCAWLVQEYKNRFE